MGIFDIFTGDPARRAAESTRAYLTQVGNNGRRDIEQGLNFSLDALAGGYDAGRGSLEDAYRLAAGNVDTGAAAALGAINGGTAGAMAQLDAARGAFDPLSALAAKYGGATSTALDALGVNGADGMARARDAFTAGPAYSFNLDQGLDAINRARNARGMANSGNTDRDAQEYGAGLASREYDKWLANLIGFTNPELSATGSAASGTAGVETNAANLLRDAGTSRAAIESGRGSMLSDLAKWYGTGQSGLNTAEGTGLAGLATNAANQRVNLGTQMAQPYSNTYNQEAQAQMQGSGNLWNFGMNAARLAAGGLPSLNLASFGFNPASGGAGSYR